MTKPWEVMKFGGSSVAAARHWPFILKLCEAKLSQGKNVLVVLSALKNISNTLQALVHQSLAGTHLIEIQSLKEYHYDFASELGLDGDTILHNLFEELQLVCETINHVQTISPENYAKVLAYGELFSTSLGAKYLDKHISACKWFDVRKILKTQQSSEHQADDDWHHFLSAECDYEYDPTIISKYQSGQTLLVTQGFIASDKNNKTVLLGREGSDTSAAYLAAIFAAKKIEIWTDVAGVFTTNPRDLPSARQLKNLSYDDARRMANFGAKVLHPIALIPAEKNHIEIVVNDIANPNIGGTTIFSTTGQYNNNPFAIVARKNITQINFNSNKKETINCLESMGYNILLEDLKSDQKQNYQHQLLMRFVDTTSPEPSHQEIQSRLSSQIKSTEDEQAVDLTFNIAILTLVGAANCDWINEVDCYVIKLLKSEFMQRISFPKSGRYSIIVADQNISQMLATLHHQFIEKNNAKDFGKSWCELEACS